MTKLKRDARAFQVRVKMGRTRLWAVVEGKDFDRTFYDRVLQEVPALNGHRFSVCLAEELEIEGKSAGGKLHALALHDLFESENALLQSNTEGGVAIAVFVDRDTDDFAPSASRGAHVIHTYHADTEAEILANGNLRRAVETSHGLGREHVEPLFSNVSDPISNLSVVWREWITLRLIANGCKSEQCARFGRVSEVNTQIYGEHDVKKSEAILSAIRAATSEATFNSERERAEDYISGRILSGEAAMLVKGKWVAGYLRYLVTQYLADEIVMSNIRDETIVGACLESLSFNDDWVHHYTKRVDAILALCA